MKDDISIFLRNSSFKLAEEAFYMLPPFCSITSLDSPCMPLNL